jgi:hypothetical protein
MAKAKKKESEITEAPFEEAIITQSETVPTFDELISKELVKFDFTEAKIKELEEQFLPLAVKSLDDEEGYMQVKEGLRFMVGKRNQIEEKRKELKADSLRYGRAVDAEAKKWMDGIAHIEAHLRTEKEKVDAEKKRKEEEIELAKQRVLRDRHDRLVAVGMNLIGDTYVYNNPIDGSQEELHKLNLESYSPDDFDFFVNNIKEVADKANAKLKAIKEEQERIRIAQEAETKRLQEEQERMRKEQEQLRAEALQFKQERYKNRAEHLLNLGLEFSGISPFLFYRGRSIITTAEVSEMDTIAWKEKVSEIASKIEQIDIEKQKEDAEKEQRRIEEEERIKKETELRFKEQQERDRLWAIEAEKERVANMSDKERMFDYIEKLLIVERPSMVTNKWEKFLSDLVKNISNTRQVIESK